MGRWIGIGLAIILVLSVGFIAVLYLYPDFRAATRDVAVVVVAFFMMISTLLSAALLILLLYAVRAVNNLAQHTIIPKVDALTIKVDQVLDNSRTITGNVQDTAATVSITTSYVAEQVVSPFVRVAGVMAGVRAAASYLARRGK